VVVVGAGIAGLSCAWRLQQAGHDVEVLEREKTPGGRMRSERRGEYLLDRGAQFIASGYRNLHQIADSLGLGHRIENIACTRNAILRDGKLRAGDYDSLGEFLRSDLLSTRAKARLPRLLFEIFRHRRRLDPLCPEKAADIDRDDMASYLRRVVGEEALEYLLAPAFSSTFDSDPEELSGAFALLAIRFLAGGFRLQCFQGGGGLLTRTLADRLSVRIGWEASAVETEAGGARVRYLAPSGEQSVIADDAVVERRREELEDDLIRVTSIMPGVFATNFIRNMDRAMVEAFAGSVGITDLSFDDQGRLSREQNADLQRRLAPMVGDVNAIARAVEYVITQPIDLNIEEIVIRPRKSLPL